VARSDRHFAVRVGFKDANTDAWLTDLASAVRAVKILWRSVRQVASFWPWRTDHHPRFGSQYTQSSPSHPRVQRLLAILRYNTRRRSSGDAAKGLISAWAVQRVSKNARCRSAIFNLGIPILGICYGSRHGHQLGGKVAHSKKREYGHGKLGISTHSPLFHGCLARSRSGIPTATRSSSRARLSHIGRTESSEYAAVEDRKRRLYGLQFHPRSPHAEGQAILRNFVRGVCGCTVNGRWGTTSQVRAPDSPAGRQRSRRARLSAAWIRPSPRR